MQNKGGKTMKMVKTARIPFGWIIRGDGRGNSKQNACEYSTKQNKKMHTVNRIEIFGNRPSSPAWFENWRGSCYPSMRRSRSMTLHIGTGWQQKPRGRNYHHHWLSIKLGPSFTLSRLLFEIWLLGEQREKKIYIDSYSSVCIDTVPYRWMVVNVELNTCNTREHTRTHTHTFMNKRREG